MKEFPSSIVASLEALFLEFNFRRLLFWVFILILFITGLTVFENLTGYAYFSRIERKVSILKILNELAKDDITSKSELNPIYQDITSELETYHVKPFSLSGIISSFSSIVINIPVEVGKFITGGLFGFLIAIAGWVDRRRGAEKWSSTFFGGLLFGILFGLIGVAIPTILNNIWINYIGFPVLQIVVILFFSLRSTRREVQ